MSSKNGNLKDRFNLGTEHTSDALDDTDIRPEDYQAFKTDPQVKPSNALIDFWLRGGNQRAFSYSHLYDIDFNPSSGMKLTFSEHYVTIKGHGLDKLYRGLKRHRIVYVWEADSPSQLLADEEEAQVTSIEIKPRFEPTDTPPA